MMNTRNTTKQNCGTDTCDYLQQARQGSVYKLKKKKKVQFFTTQELYLFGDKQCPTLMYKS